MVLKLYGTPTSVSTLRAALILKEKNVYFQLIPINLTRNENKSRLYLDKQPFGQVPYISEDDGFLLFESRAIARYIASKYSNRGDNIIPDPTDLKKTALFEQAASIELSSFDPLVSGIVFEKKFKSREGFGQTDEAVVARLTQQLNEKLDAYEVLLSTMRYLAGDEVTLADLFHLPYGSMLKTVDIDVLQSDKRPNVERWWKDIVSRPSWQAIKDGL